MLPALPRLGQRFVPFRRLVVAAADPHHSDQLGGLVDIEILEQLAQFLLAEILLGLLGQSVMQMGVLRLAVEFDLMLAAVGIILVDGGAERARLLGERRTVSGSMGGPTRVRAVLAPVRCRSLGSSGAMMHSRGTKIEPVPAAPELSPLTGSRHPRTVGPLQQNRCSPTMASLASPKILPILLLSCRTSS